MPSKKKTKPSFQVPEDLQTAPQAGWVYRSDGPAPRKASKAPAKSRPAAKARLAESVAPAAAASSPPPKKAETKKSEAAKSNSSSSSSHGVLDLTSRALSAGFEAAGDIARLTTRFLTMPFSLGKRMLGL